MLLYLCKMLFFRSVDQYLCITQGIIAIYNDDKKILLSLSQEHHAANYSAVLLSEDLYNRYQKEVNWVNSMH